MAGFTMVNMVAPSQIETLTGNIRRLLQERRWSQGKLAARAKVSESYISRLLAGDYQSPGVAKLNKIARALGVPVQELTGDTPSEQPYLSPIVASLVEKA